MLHSRWSFLHQNLERIFADLPQLPTWMKFKVSFHRIYCRNYFGRITAIWHCLFDKALTLKQSHLFKDFKCLPVSLKSHFTIFKIPSLFKAKVPLGIKSWSCVCKKFVQPVSLVVYVWNRHNCKYSIIILYCTQLLILLRFCIHDVQTDIKSEAIVIYNEK